MIAKVDGLKINYRKSGAGKTVLLLHGWGDDQSTFDSMKRSLSKRFTVITVDLPGFGKSDEPKDDWGLTEYARFINAFLRKIGRRKAYAVVGHSSGGATAVRGVAQGLVRCDRLVLLDSSGVQGYRYKKRARVVHSIARVGKHAAKPLPGSMQSKLRSKVRETVGTGALVSQSMQGTFQRILRDDIQPDAATIDVPTLLIYGDRDGVTPPFFGQVLHSLMPASAFKLLKGEHFIHHDQPDKVNNIISGFLDPSK